MSLGNHPTNNDFAPESHTPESDQFGTNLANSSPLDGAFNSSLSEWRSAMKAMNPDQNVQVAGILPSPTELFNSVHKWLYPPKAEVPPPKADDPAPPLESTGAKTLIQAASTTFESFTTSDKKNPPSIDQLPVGGPHLEGRSKNVVTSYYNDGFTANGERFDSNALTAAHRTLPFNTIVDLEYTDPTTGVTRVVKGVRINDDGPKIKGDDSATKVARKPRELDVSSRVARELGFYTDGVGVVKMTIVKWGDNRYANGGVHEAGNDFRNKSRELQRYWGRSNFSIYK
ncbi:MAG: septal ring lytic transglycosylase RlpA family protein [Candidatus Melainabacteria bacterium]|nr:septal ring lytic transglycosylase RlpA family protein [Candidatus Melainabacteria bacterium]